jgi:TRAP-type C4-dicarboxylate transport system substrate-binding protein
MTRILVLLTLLTSTAIADQRVLRMAAIAPDGTSWARELKAFARDVETNTGGQLRIKWYLGGIAGDEPTAVERTRKGQLDGVAGAIFCQQLAPAMRVLRVPGMFESREEAFYVMGRMRADIETEMRASGFAFLGSAGFGFDAIFSRAPVKSLADLKLGRFWLWSLDTAWRAMGEALGLAIVNSSIDEAAKIYDAEHLDGMIAEPTAALAYQWSTLTKYFTPLGAAFLPGCMVVANRTFDELQIDQQQVVRVAAAKFFVRFNDVSEATNRALEEKLFEKQGLIKVPLSATFRADFLHMAREAQERLGESVVSKSMLGRVRAWIGEYHAQSRAGVK